MFVRDKIPYTYHRFFPELLDLEIPEERFADCSNCTLCHPGDKSPYLNTKCCAYFPHLPNYMLGGVLSDTDPSMEKGRERIRALISEKRGVSPYGIVPSREYSELRKAVYAKSIWSIGREENEKLLCPYYDQGHCSVWKYRENLCVTFFCRTAAGKKGEKFWNEVNSLLKTSEQKLAKYALMKSGWPAERIFSGTWDVESLAIDTAEGAVKGDRYEKLWREWDQDPAELYIRCFEVIDKLDLESYRKIMGLDGDIHMKHVRAAWSKLEGAVIPERLILEDGVIFEKIDLKETEVRAPGGTVRIPSLHVNFIRLFREGGNVDEVYRKASELLIVIESSVLDLMEIGALKEP